MRFFMDAAFVLLSGLFDCSVLSSLPLEAGRPEACHWSVPRFPAGRFLGFPLSPQVFSFSAGHLCGKRQFPSAFRKAWFINGAKSKVGRVPTAKCGTSPRNPCSLRAMCAASILQPSSTCNYMFIVMIVAFLPCIIRDTGGLPAHPCLRGFLVFAVSATIGPTGC